MKKIAFILVFLTTTTWAEDTVLFSLGNPQGISLTEMMNVEGNECSFPQGQCPGPNWFCLNGYCVEENTGPRCWTDRDCAIGAHCDEGVCRVSAADTFFPTAIGGLCFNDSQCLPNEHCAIGGSGAGECRENQIVGECRVDADCNWPKMCIGWYCR